MAHLSRLRLAGWKSIRDAVIELRPLNVLIGANGAGKSNLVSFFKLLNHMMGGRLQVHVGKSGGAEALLHYGSKRTSAVEADFQFLTDQGRINYSMSLVPAAGNSLVFGQDKLELHREGAERAESWPLGGGHQESMLLSGPPVEKFVITGGAHVHTESHSSTDTARTTLEIMRGLLSRCRVFHFHDTSSSGPMRRDYQIDLNRYLYPDASNLPSMLYLYQERYPTAYRRIVAAVKVVAPYFEDFILEPLRLNPRNIALHWRAKGTDYEFGPHQLSDGTLRAIAIFTLLLQPLEDLPAMIVLDEPELGLHPAALAALADLMKETARHCQLLIATQSALLLDHFEVEDVVTVNLRDGCSTFDRLDPEQLEHWLAEYTLSELWERNVIGGGPY